MSDAPVRPLPGEVEEARQIPNGWVYRIAHGYPPDQRVPPQAIVGAWRVDAQGQITGEFVPNPRHTPFMRAAGLPGFEG